VGEIEEIVTRLAAADPTFKASVRCFFVRHPFEVLPEATIVKVLRQAATKVLGKEPAYTGQTPWMDAALLSAAGVETVVMGPHGGGAHSAEEWVDLQSLVDLAHILAQTALDYCQ